MNSAKEYLQQVKSCETRIKSIREKLQNLEDQVQKITPLLSPSGGGGGSKDPLGDAVAGIADLKRILAEETVHYNTIKAEVEDLLGKIKKKNMREVLTNRYLRYHSWRRIADEMHYTKDGTLKLHRRALNVVERLLTEKVST